MSTKTSKFDRLAWQREYRKRNNNSCTKAYEKSKSGKIMRTYRNMKSRVEGVLKKKAHLYGGLPLIDKSSFYEWSLSDEDFNRLFKEWEGSGHELKLSPSIDRIKTELGYEMGNIRWVTFSENSREGGKWSSMNE